MKRIVQIVQGILAVGFMMSGLAKLFSSVEQINDSYTESLGYSTAFIYLIAATETVSALALIVGFKWRLVAAGASIVLAVVMIGAIMSHLAANEAANALLPAVYLLLLTVLLARFIRIRTPKRT